MPQRFACIVLVATALCLGCQQPNGLTPTDARVLQTLDGFHRPESCTFSQDGKTFFVSNVASGTYGPEENFLLVRGEGFISKLAVDEQGQARMIEREFVTGLDAPLGITVLPKATSKFPAGTLFVNVGFWLQGREDGTYTAAPAELGTGITAIDPETGDVLGHIPVGEGSKVAEALGFACYGLNGACFDGEGNFYAAEHGEAATTDPARTGQAGILKIPHDAIDPLAAGQAARGVAFQPVPFGPNGVAWRASDNHIYFVTSSGGEDPRGGAVFRVPQQSFPVEPLPEPAIKGVGKLDGIAFTPAGTTLVSRMSGDLFAFEKGFASGRKIPLGFELKSPSDIKLQVLPDGSSILAVPEQQPAGEPNAQRVRLIDLPKDF
jgi:hypothetical protein